MSDQTPYNFNLPQHTLSSEHHQPPSQQPLANFSFQESYSYPPYPPYPYIQPTAPKQPSGWLDSLAIIGLILGIASMSAMFFPWLGLLIAPPGIIFSTLGRIFTQRKNMAIIGLVLSFVSLLLIIGNILDYLGTLH